MSDLEQNKILKEIKEEIHRARVFAPNSHLWIIGFLFTCSAYQQKMNLLFLPLDSTEKVLKVVEFFILWPFKLGALIFN